MDLVDEGRSRRGVWGRSVVDPWLGTWENRILRKSLADQGRRAAECEDMGGTERALF